MIARVDGGTVHLITQPDHARLARYVMERCVPLASHDRRDDILHAAGADTYFTKPIDWERLGSVLRKYKNPQSPQSVLIIEDDSDIRRGRPTLHRAFDDATAVNDRDAPA